LSIYTLRVNSPSLLHRPQPANNLFIASKSLFLRF
jgi:hypothetical protein